MHINVQCRESFLALGFGRPWGWGQGSSRPARSLQCQSIRNTENKKARWMDTRLSQAPGTRCQVRGPALCHVSTLLGLGFLTTHPGWSWHRPVHKVSMGLHLPHLSLSAPRRVPPTARATHSPRRPCAWQDARRVGIRVSVSLRAGICNVFLISFIRNSQPPREQGLLKRFVLSLRE